MFYDSGTFLGSFDRSAVSLSNLKIILIYLRFIYLRYIYYYDSLVWNAHDIYQI